MTFHHPIIACRPQERISRTTYPNGEWQLGPGRSTGVQGHTLFTASFSRTCPVALQYPKTGRSIEGLAIIDDQATLSLVYPDVIEELGIAHSDISSSALTTTTINGTKSQMCQSVQNLMISPLSGDPPINLENALTQDLPNVIQDIPTPTEVLSIPGLSHLTS